MLQKSLLEEYWCLLLLYLPKGLTPTRAREVSVGVCLFYFPAQYSPSAPSLCSENTRLACGGWMAGLRVHWASGCLVMHMW